MRRLVFMVSSLIKPLERCPIWHQKTDCVSDLRRDIVCRSFTCVCGGVFFRKLRALRRVWRLLSGFSVVFCIGTVRKGCSFVYDPDKFSRKTGTFGDAIKYMRILWRDYRLISGSMTRHSRLIPSILAHSIETKSQRVESNIQHDA